MIWLPPTIAPWNILHLFVFNAHHEAGLDDITFLMTLKKSDGSSVFEVSVNGDLRILKVVCHFQKQPCLPSWPLWLSPVSYRCKAILAPWLQRSWSLHLRKHRLRRLQEQGKINDAYVFHNDAWPRNMMVQPSTDRVLWIDFVSAHAFSHRSDYWLAADIQLTNELMDFLVGTFYHPTTAFLSFFFLFFLFFDGWHQLQAEDVKEGKLSRACGYYYHYSWFFSSVICLGIWKDSRSSWCKEVVHWLWF